MMNELHPLLSNNTSTTPQSQPKRASSYYRIPAVSFVAASLILVVIGLAYPRSKLHALEQEHNPRQTDMLKHPNRTEDSFPLVCDRHLDCRQSQHIERVPKGREAFPSFLSYTGHPYDVTYDGRSIIINGTRSLLLGGSLHPSRSTKATWEMALNEAVLQGLNLITVYVIWAAHQPLRHKPIDWTLQHNLSCSDRSSIPALSCSWDLADAIQAAAKRGLFVHIRLGPYVCAEYSYGGIPEWVPLLHKDMAMRRPNKEWMEVMEAYLDVAVTYLTEHKLFAYQGGPIIMAQIENELGGDIDQSTNVLMQVDKNQNFVKRGQDEGARNATLQDYANWCGRLATRLSPFVVWTMCYGLTAENTIETYNGFFYDTTWLENGGNSGRIQDDQPAIWTEAEGGFQIWGEEPNHPTDYVWGTTARSMAYTALKWFARGGSHLNLYMWWGGYNRGRSPAAGVTNAYATDAAMCSSGQRRHPKFDHFRELFLVLQAMAPTILALSTAINASTHVPIKSSNNNSWILDDSHFMFLYSDIKDESKNDILFIENASNVSSIVRIPIRKNHSHKYYDVFHMEAYSIAVYSGGTKLYESSVIKDGFERYQRRFELSSSQPQNWTFCVEPVRDTTTNELTYKDSKPIEQTKALFDRSTYSDYVWYATNFSVSRKSASTVVIETQEANAFIVYVDDIFFNASDTHNHLERNVTLHIPLGVLETGQHSLSLLSESLGYSNLIGRWGAGTKAKLKGVTGSVHLLLDGQSMKLTDGRSWNTHAGLHGISNELSSRYTSTSEKQPKAPRGGGLWSSSRFLTPKYDPRDKALFLEITNGRGHVYLNGHDLGRYWNITRGDTGEYSQRFYFLPCDFLQTTGNSNELVVFDVFGDPLELPRLTFSWTERSQKSQLRDEVDFPFACV